MEPKNMMKGFTLEISIEELERRIAPGETVLPLNPPPPDPPPPEPEGEWG